MGTWLDGLLGARALSDLLSAEGLAIDAPARLWSGAALWLILVCMALYRGPVRLRVPDVAGSALYPRAERGSAGHSSPSRSERLTDPGWLLSLGIRSSVLALVLLAAAGPVGLVPDVPATGSGVDLMIAIDASGSMNALDGTLEGRRVTRLEVARRVVADLIRKRRGDRIGLIVFGGKVFTQCPLTLDHRIVLQGLERVRVGLAGDFTALGEAIGLATRRLSGADRASGGQRVLLLLTDGRHNSGELVPQAAARIAAREGVRVHTVGIGGSGAVPFARGDDARELRFERVDLDTTTLDLVARTTGGRFFLAKRPSDLAQVAAAIDGLEHRQQSEPPRYRRSSLAPLCLAFGLVLLFVEAATALGVTRRLP